MFVVYDEDMKVKPFPYGVTPLDIFISSINKIRTKESIDGVNGYIDKGYTYSTRDIEVSMRLKASDTRDYRLLRDEVFSFFSENDYLYISEEYQPGKRYKVVPTESFIPSRVNKTVSSVEIPLEMYELPFAESILTTADIQSKGLEFGQGWSFGMGLSFDDDSQKYTHTGKSFRIFNAGNVPIHPFEQELIVSITNVTGSTSFFELKNNTTGDAFRITEAVTSDKKIVLDGPNITINGLASLRKTNRKYIGLKAGWNDFTINGATSAKVDFSFRFYYL